MNMIHPKTALSRFQLLKAMNTVVQSLVNEDALFLWNHRFPQAADDDDLVELVTDDQKFDQMCMLFRICIEKGAVSGFLPFVDNDQQSLFGAGTLPVYEANILSRSSAEDHS